jgi:hypothetical protein
MRVVYLLCGASVCMPAWCAVDPGFILLCVVAVSGGGKYTNRYNTNEEEPTVYCTTSMNANHYTWEEIYHPQYSYWTGGKGANRYNASTCMCRRDRFMCSMNWGDVWSGKQLVKCITRRCELRAAFFVIYRLARNVFFRNLRETNKNIETLLFGNDEISINKNSNIFNKVRAYIRQYIRYKNWLFVYIKLYI